MWRPHPWHGLETGPNPPGVVHVFVEMTPFDTLNTKSIKKQAI